PEFEHLGSYEDVVKLLQAESVTVPSKLSGGAEDQKLSLLRILLLRADRLAVGVTNGLNEDEAGTFLYHNVAVRLLAFGLADHGKAPSGVHWQRIQLSKLGVQFVAKA